MAFGVMVAWDAELDMEEEESAEVERASGVEDVKDNDDPLAPRRDGGTAI